MPGAASSYNKHFNNQNEKPDYREAGIHGEQEVTDIARKLRMDNFEENESLSKIRRGIINDEAGRELVGVKEWKKIKAKHGVHY